MKIRMFNAIPGPKPTFVESDLDYELVSISPYGITVRHNDNTPWIIPFENIQERKVELRVVKQ